MSHFKLFVAGSIVAAVALGTNAAFAEPLSEEQWRKQASSLCKQLDKDVDKLGREFVARGNNRDTPKGLAALAEEASPLFDEAFAAIDALDEPAALTKRIKRFEAAASAALTVFRTDPAAVIRGGVNPFAKADKIARRLGLKACTSGQRVPTS